MWYFLLCELALTAIVWIVDVRVSAREQQDREQRHREVLERLARDMQDWPTSRRAS